MRKPPLFITLALMAACTQSAPKPPRLTVSAESQARAFAAAYLRPAGKTPAPAPATNPSSPEKVALGRRLFFDTRLSSSGVISCATCHNPALEWGDGLSRAVGHDKKQLARRTPTILDVAYADALMWDGRFDSLEAQVFGPITSPNEMNMPAAVLVERLKGVESYRRDFDRLFPKEGVTVETVSFAVASFERTITSPVAPFDRWVSGEADAISEPAKRGFVLFNTKATCSKCHAGWRLSDDSFHDIGVEDHDLGRGALDGLETLTSMQHAFKTPTLRSVELRAPYLHDGSAKTLADVLTLYEGGGRAVRESLAPELTYFTLTERERADLLALLKTFSPATGSSSPPPVALRVQDRSEEQER